MEKLKQSVRVQLGVSGRSPYRARRTTFFICTKLLLSNYFWRNHKTKRWYYSNVWAWDHESAVTFISFSFRKFCVDCREMPAPSRTTVFLEDACTHSSNEDEWWELSLDCIEFIILIEILTWHVCNVRAQEIVQTLFRCHPIIYVLQCFRTKQKKINRKSAGHQPLSLLCERKIN